MFCKCTKHKLYSGLVFVLDHSEKVGSSDFQKEITFMKNALFEFSVSPSHARVSMIRFASSVSVDIDLSPNQKCQLFKDIASRVIYQGGGTNTNGGLMAAQRQLRLNSRGGNEMRVVVIITDGVWDEGGDPVHTAKALKNQDNAILIAMGVGNTEYQKLADIASAGLVFRVEGFHEFKTVGGTHLWK